MSATEDLRLSLLAFRLLSWLGERSPFSGGLGEMGKKLGFTDRYIRKALGELVKFGYVRVLQQPGKPSTIAVLKGVDRIKKRPRLEKCVKCLRPCRPSRLTGWCRSCTKLAPIDRRIRDLEKKTPAGGHQRADAKATVT